ncbi:MAG: ATP-binding protein [Patescibacteria group bacterium]
MDTKALILFFISLFNLGLATLIIFRNWKERVNIFYSLTLTAISFWSFGLGMFILSSFENGRFWAIFYYISASFIVTCFLYFARAFVSKNIVKTSFLKHLLFHCPSIAIIIILLTNFHFIKEYTLEPWGKNIKLGYFYFFYVTHVVVYIGYSIMILFKHFSFVSGIKKTQLKFIFLGTSIASFATIPNLFLPLFTYKFVWFGPYPTLIMIIAVAYAITKHHLMDIKTITSEILTGLLLSILFINIFVYNGNLIWFRLAIFLASSVVGYFLIKSVFKEVRQREHIEKLLKMRSEFLDIASHQLKTPVSVIMGTASMFKEGSIQKLPKEQQDKFIDNIYRKSVKLSGIIRDILSASEFDTEKFSLPESRLEPVDLDKFLEKIKEDFSDDAKEKGLGLNFIKKKSVIPPIISDEFYLTQAIVNIIDNAIKYTKIGKVDIFLDEDEKNVFVKIKDTGVGIPEKDKPKIFGKFERASNAVDMYTDGSGLGLFISKEIIGAHNGANISFNSKEGEGTEFVITFQKSNGKDGK